MKKYLILLSLLGFFITFFQLHQLSQNFNLREQCSANALFINFSMLQVQTTENPAEFIKLKDCMTPQALDSVIESLRIDYFFMPFCYGYIILGCHGASLLAGKFLKRFFSLLITFPAAAWIFDLVENIYHEKWLTNFPIDEKVFEVVHYLILAKFALALFAFIVSITYLIFKSLSIIKRKKVMWQD
ncbi:hypothetical protein NF867_05015 [Solitalea sp. MAHUQ-68]|uniref:Uncharacterized protein n=1 Tax=Solitalea agri TaxID=2953739 RepID=A0A9X2F0Y2_9SPHI|nr:hypothetical protein [Solitalea agri]MCO4292221.1 hypothetical protein [Solitalea agri]